MKRSLIFVLFILILLMQVSALTIDLVSPVNNAIYVDSNAVVFKCKATGDDLRFIELYTNVNSWSKKAEVSNPQNNAEVAFSIKNITNGDYLWNCKVIDGTEGIKFSSSNRSFSVNKAPNNAPTYNGGLTSQSWNMNAQKNNVFDLDDFFSDQDGNVLTYTVSGNANINVNINANNQVSFSEPSNWFGTEKIKFTASDGGLTADSSYINLTVIKTDTQGGSSSSNTAPIIENKIPDQNKSTTVDSWLLDLTGHAKDNEDSESKLNWYVYDVNSDLLKVEIDNVNKRVKFTANKKAGTDTITFTVTDSGGLNASQNIKVNIIDTQEKTSDNTEFANSESNLTIEKYSPIDQEVVIETNKITVFDVETNIKGDVEWYLDNELTPETKNSFSFNSIEESTHNLTVYVTDLDKTVSRTWDITVKKPKEVNLAVNNPKPICGNNIKEEGEDCSTCTSDVKCSDSQVCNKGVCEERKSLFSITGDAIKNIKPTKTGLYILVIIVVIFLGSIVVIRRRNKEKHSHLEQFSHKEGLIKRLQKRLRRMYFEKRQKRINKINLKKLEHSKIEEITNIAPSILSISSFVKESMEKGHNKRQIKRALRKRGWSRIQIWKAFRRL